MNGRRTISVAMLSALVTTVIAGRSEDLARSPRAASWRAVALVVVPPFKPTTVPRSTMSAAARAMRCLASSDNALLYRAGSS